MGMEGFITPCPIGLDYPAVYAVAKTLNIDIAPATLFKLQALEFYEKNRKPKEGDNGSE
jgi:hypothetical protein